MTKTELITLIVIRDMSNERKYTTADTVHWYLQAGGVRLHDNYDDNVRMTTEAIEDLQRRGLIKEIEVLEYGRVWEELRATEKALAMIKSMLPPVELRILLAPIVIK